MFHVVQEVPVILATLLGQQGTLATLQSSRALISQWSVWQTLPIQVSSTAGPIPVGQELVVVSTQFVVQWNLSIMDTIGTQLAVLYREVS